MNDKIGKLIYGVACIVNIGSILGLANIALKRNKDCYNAESKLIETEMDLIDVISECNQKDQEIELLKAEIDLLKEQEEES
jgi:hypothetical protein